MRIGIGLKVMLQIIFNHLLSHLTYRGTKITSRPKVPAPVTLLYMGELFEQFARCSPFNSSHHLTRGQRRWTTDKDVNMIFADHTLDNPNLKCFAGLPDQISNALRYYTRENLISILCHPDKVVFNLIDRMAAIPVLHALLPWLESSIAAKADRLKPLV